ncbi:hypothetical protein AAF712_016230 [Marasmius tenuissimus]|uniref:JmjC domain-containing protein n=1 Tax=Marasmius tenuissimus TaxID=585030 RepID=A0ABR2Z799_9AGAR
MDLNPNYQSETPPMHVNQLSHEHTPSSDNIEKEDLPPVAQRPSSVVVCRQDSSRLAILDDLPKWDATKRYVEFASFPWQTDVVNVEPMELRVTHIPPGYQRAAVTLMKTMSWDWSEDLTAPLYQAIGPEAKQAAEKYYRGILGWRCLDGLPNVSGFKDLASYTSLIRQVNTAVLEESESWPSCPSKPANATNEAWHIYLVTWQYSTMKKHSKLALLHRVLNNLTIVAFVMTFFKMGYGDLPTDKQMMREALTKSAEDAGSTELSELIIAAFDKGNFAASRMRGALYLALTISPLILLSGISPMSGDIVRRDLLLYWLHLGNDPPPLIATLNRELWLTIKRIVDGECTPLESLKLFLREVMVWIPESDALDSNLPEEERRYFDKGYGLSLNEITGNQVAIQHRNTLRCLSEGPASSDNGQVDWERGARLLAPTTDPSMSLPAATLSEGTNNDNIHFLATPTSSIEPAGAVDVVTASTIPTLAPPVGDVSVEEASRSTSPSLAHDGTGPPPPDLLPSSGGPTANDPSLRNIIDVTTNDAVPTPTTPVSDTTTGVLDADGRLVEANVSQIQIGDSTSIEISDMPAVPAPSQPNTISLSESLTGSTVAKTSAMPDTGAVLTCDASNVSLVVHDVQDDMLDEQRQPDISDSGGKEQADEPMEVDNSQAHAINVQPAEGTIANECEDELVDDEEVDDEEVCDEEVEEKANKGKKKRKGKQTAKQPALPRLAHTTKVKKLLFPILWLRDPMGAVYAYQPQFYEAHIYREVVRLLKASSAIDEKVLNLTPVLSLSEISDPEEDEADLREDVPWVSVMTDNDYSARSRRQIQEHFSCAHIVIRGPTVPEEDSSFNRQTLQRVGSVTQWREIHDLSLRGESDDANDQIVRGNLLDMLKHASMAKGKGKILNILDIVASDGGEGFRATELASDVFVRKQNVHKKSLTPFSSRPTDATFWHLVATAGASHPCHFDTAGYGTCITVQTGLKLFIIGVPGEHASHEETNGLVSFGSFEHDMTNSVGLIPRAFLLYPGDTIVMRPCTLHYVVTLAPSVCHGSHFYTATTMTDTLFGILHLFLHRNHATNQEDVEHRVTLARMICTWADLLVNSDYFPGPNCPGSGPWADLPDLTTVTGIFNFLSLYNVVQFGSLLWTERYERQKLDARLVALYKDARLAGDAILNWLDHSIYIKCTTVENDEWKVHGNSIVPAVHEGSVAAMRDSYLSQQLLALRKAMANLPPGSCSSSITQSTYNEFMMEDMSRLPSVYARLEAFDSPTPRRLGGYPLPDSQLASYAWEFRYFDQPTTYYIVALWGQETFYSESAADTTRLMRNYVREKFLGDDTKATELKKVYSSIIGDATASVADDDQAKGDDGPVRKKRKLRK